MDARSVVDMMGSDNILPVCRTWLRRVIQAAGAAEAAGAAATLSLHQFSGVAVLQIR